jgi:hypothetical protein
MANFVELEPLYPLLNGVDIEISHLRASQGAFWAPGWPIPGANQPSPSDVIDFAEPFNLSLEIEFGNWGSAFFLGLLQFKVSYFFESVTGGPVPAPVTVGPLATAAGTYLYSGQSPAANSTLAPVAGGALAADNIYRVGAIVTVGFTLGGAFSTLYKGFIDGLVLGG